MLENYEINNDPVKIMFSYFFETVFFQMKQAYVPVTISSCIRLN